MKRISLHGKIDVVKRIPWNGNRGTVLWLLLVALALPSCAPRKPFAYRLIPRERSLILVPPRLDRVDAPRFSLAIPAVAWGSSCNHGSGTIQTKPLRKKVRLDISPVELVKAPQGWLGIWAAEAEARGCVPPGQASELAARVLESVPIDPSSAYRLLHEGNVRTGYIDLGPENRLQVVAPIMKAGVAPDAPVLSTAATEGDGRQITISISTTDNLTGVETSWYGLQPKLEGDGSTLVPLSSERVIQGRSEAFGAPLTNYIRFSRSASYYRLFYKTDPGNNGITEIVLAAPSVSELRRRTAALMADSFMCRESDPDKCAVIPRRVAVNPYIAVKVNGREVRLPIGGSVRAAIRMARGPSPEHETLRTLRISKPYGRTLAPVLFDRSREDVLSLTLLGGEQISWE